MPQNSWTINNASGGQTGADLVGCKIQQTSTGYDFTSPDGAVLDSTRDNSLPITFRNFQYDSYTWTVVIDTLSSAASGSWHNTAGQSPTAEEGTWSAGSGTDPKNKADSEPESRAAAK